MSRTPAGGTGAAVRRDPRQTWQAAIALAYGEVQPLVLATDVERRDTLTVHVVLIAPVDDVHPDGHGSTGPVLSREFEVPTAPFDEQLRAMRQGTIAQSSSRLRVLLSVLQ